MAGERSERAPAQTLDQRLRALRQRSVLPARLMAPFVAQRMRAPEMAPHQADLIALGELVESGKVTPVVERTYPLLEVPEAIRYFEKGHARGKVVITVLGADQPGASPADARR